MASQLLRKQKRKPASFFKVLIHDFSTRLQIPPAFMKEFGEDDDVPKKATLETYNGKSWEVGVEKLGNKFYFNKGWHKFVRVNGLENGDFLALKYFADYSKFRVRIYGRTCCEKQLNVVGESCSKPLNNGKQDQRNEQEGRRKRKKRINEEEEEEDGDDNENKAAFKSGEIKLENDDSSFCFVDDDDEEQEIRGTQKRKSQTVEFKRNEKYSRMPPDYHNHIEFESENPFFQLQLKLTSTTYYLYIPKGFLKDHMEGKRRMKLEVSERTWNIKIHVYELERRRRKRTKEARVIEGWKRLVIEHHLEIGDVCFFEMIQSYDSDDDDDDLSVFRVHVYRWDHKIAKFCQII